MSSVRLVMRHETFDELWLKAQVPTGAACEGAVALKEALRASKPTGRWGGLSVLCNAAALEFIRSEAPEIARRWSRVFGDVEVPRSHQLMSVAMHAIGQTAAGVQLDPDGALRLEFESGAALVINVDGRLAWQHGG